MPWRSWRRPRRFRTSAPTDVTRLSLELAARMIYVWKAAASLEEAREVAQNKLLDGSGYRKLKEVIEAQGGNPRSSTSSSCCRTPRVSAKSPRRAPVSSARSMPRVSAGPPP